MALKILRQNDDTIRFEFENSIPIWNIFKYMAEVPYLKQFVVEGYDGGNTLVPMETWHEEGILFKEIGKGVYFFPYESIGFVVDDSIHNLKLYMIDLYRENMDYRKETDMAFEIKDTDQAALTIPTNKMNGFIALYLFSITKLGYDNKVLENMKSLVKSLVNDTTETLEYVASSVTMSIKGASFLIIIQGKSGDTEHYRISLHNRKCRKELLKEEEIRNFGFFKKKILAKNKYLPYVYIAVPVLAGILLLIFNRKLLIIGLILYVILRFVYLWLKKNAYRLFKGKSES